MSKNDERNNNDQNTHTNKDIVEKQKSEIPGGTSGNVPDDEDDYAKQYMNLLQKR